MAVAEVDACVFDAMNTSVDEEGHGVVAPVGVVPPETQTPTDTPGLPPLTPVPVLKPLISPLVSPLASPLEMVEAVSSSQGISALRPAKPLPVRPPVTPPRRPPEKIKGVSSSHGVSTVPPSKVVLVSAESQPLPVSNSARQASERCQHRR
ncbi:unnamed protein product [Phytophthora fragariaefolia]|uniref:Unnamed protein product n=1 Tax=Phytophthora fragariaefolia TaxID=1490495 RepID=A0A9W7D5K0_9STRA|nr:unnamed protein product [Phytophthora fragariaefolia]